MSYLIIRPFLTRRVLTSLTTSTLRPLSTTTSLFKPHQEQNTQPSNPRVLATLERTILSPERAESTCSGTDNSVGSDTFAYDPTTTTPEVELSAFEGEIRVEGDSDPLFISPANRDFSQLLDRDLDGRAIVRDKGDRCGVEGSSRGWVNKKRVIKVRGLFDKKGKEKVVGMDEYERLLRGLRRVQMERRVVFSVNGTGTMWMADWCREEAFKKNTGAEGKTG
ncbi:hypothetical protein BJY04DRAFT_219719 [Aspergillus karnatakaensis]|uniref:uncharacterized protein n=1 Tax=Aspergillus karnatakaensis TaxID=1810916 RepID=UPI003CCE4101